MFITLSELKRHLGVEAADRDEKLDAIVRGVNAWVMKKLGREFRERTLVEMYRGTDCTTLVLRHYPVKAVSSVEVDGSALAVGDGRDAKVSWSENGVLVRTDGSVWEDRKRRDIVVRYTAGTERVPEDLVFACLEMAAFAYKASAGSTGLSVGGVSETLWQGAMDEVPNAKAILDRYTDDAAPFVSATAVSES